MRGHATQGIVTFATVVASLCFASNAGAAAAAAPSGSNLVLAPPAHGQVYRAAFPGFGGTEDHVSVDRIRRFERLSGSRIAWAYFSNNWFGGHIHFPAEHVREVSRSGAMPFVRMMPRSGYRHGADPNFSMQSIADGSWDPELRRWCDGARDAGVPLLVEFGTEVNGDWFPWNGRWNGAGHTDGYGNPHEADGPERFRDAYRRIVDLCRGEGADNITWFFHVDVSGWPHARWNRISSYWPGSRYVDWIGLSDYGPQKPGEPWVSFRRRLDRVYDRVTALGPEPIAMLEYGASEQPGHPGRKAGWIRRTIGDVAADRWPRLNALSYWNEAWRNGDGSVSDLRIDSSRRSLRAYRRGIGRRVFTSHARFVARGT
jgi:Glycosyl hydrolase family 26